MCALTWQNQAKPAPIDNRALGSCFRSIIIISTVIIYSSPPTSLQAVGWPAQASRLERRAALLTSAPSQLLESWLQAEYLYPYSFAELKLFPKPTFPVAVALHFWIQNPAVRRRWWKNSLSTNCPHLKWLNKTTFTAFWWWESDTHPVGTVLWILIFSQASNIRYNALLWCWVVSCGSQSVTWSREKKKPEQLYSELAC